MGRPSKYPKLKLKRGQVVSFKQQKGLQIAFLAQGKKRGWKLRTWHDEGQLVVLRVK